MTAAMRRQYADTLHTSYRRFEQLRKVRRIAGNPRILRRLPDKAIRRIPQQLSTVTHILRNGNSSIAVLRLGCTDIYTALNPNQRLLDGNGRPILRNMSGLQPI